MEFTETDIKNAFSDRTFARGFEYFSDDAVRERIRFTDTLWGTVAGSKADPYRTKISFTGGGKRILCECSCPVGDQCKHGVALALCWVHEPESFTDAPKVLATLGAMSKTELLTLLERLIRAEPSLVSQLDLRLESAATGGGKGGINLKAINKRIKNALYGDLDYYHIDAVVHELWEIKELADEFIEKAAVNYAVEIYLLLLEGILEAFERGADDSDGTMGDLAIECREALTEILTASTDQEFKNNLITRLIDLYKREDYGLDLDEILPSVTTPANISRIEALLLEFMRLETENQRGTKQDYHSSYIRNKIKSTLTDLYQTAGLTDRAEALVLSTLEGVEDYLFASRVLMKQGKLEDARQILKKGLNCNLGDRAHELHRQFIKLIEQFLASGKGEALDAEEFITHASEVFSSSRRFDAQEFQWIKNIAGRLGVEERFIEAIKLKFDANPILVEMLVEIGKIEQAVDVMKRSKGRDRNGTLAMKLALLAKESGNNKIAMEMTLFALMSRYAPYHALTNAEKELISELLHHAPEPVLKTIIGQIVPTKPLVLFIAETLAARSLPLVYDVLSRLQTSLEAKEIRIIVEKLGKEGASVGLKLAERWIENVGTRAHTYYDTVIELLKLLKTTIEGSGVSAEKDWQRFVSTFKITHRSKKKLMEKVRTIGL